MSRPRPFQLQTMPVELCGRMPNRLWLQSDPLEGWRWQSIPILIGFVDSDGIEHRDYPDVVPAIVNGAWAVHWGVDPDFRRGWAVTHRPSGRQLAFVGGDWRNAIRCAARLSAYFLDEGRLCQIGAARALRAKWQGHFTPEEG